MSRIFLKFRILKTIVKTYCVRRNENALHLHLPLFMHCNSGGASSEKSKRNGGGEGILTYYFNLKVYPTSFFDNFCRLLGFGVDKNGAATAPQEGPNIIQNGCMQVMVLFGTIPHCAIFKS